MPTDLPLAGGRHHRDRLRVGLGPVGDVALQVADGDRGALLGPDAQLLALGLLGADPAGDARQGVVAEERVGRAGHVALAEPLDEARDVDPDRAAVDALGVLALEAALGLQDGQLVSEAQVDLGEAVGALLGVLLGHADAIEEHPLLGADLGILTLQDAADQVGGGG